MSITFSDSVKSDRLQAFTRALDAGSSGAKLYLYGGTQPSAGESHTDPIVCEFTFPSPSLNSVTGGTLTLKNPPPAMALADSVVTWARLADSNGAWVADCTAGGTSSGAVIQVQNAAGSVFSGGQVSISIATLTEV